MSGDPSYPSAEEAYAMAFGAPAAAAAPEPASYPPASAPSYGRGDRLCNQCGLPGHIARECPENMVCRKCGGSGHQQAACTYQPPVRLDEGETDTIYIDGLPPSVTEEDLVELFGSIGVVRMVAGKGRDRTKKPKVWIYKDKVTGQPKGDATFSYEDPHSAPAAVKWFDGQEYKGRKLKVSLAARKEAPQTEGGWGAGGGGGGGGAAGYGGGGGGRGGYGGGDSYGGGGFRGGRGGFGGGRGGGGAGAPNPGDWTCPQCNNMCWARRTECNRCGTPNPNPEAAAAASRGGRGGFSSDRGGRGGYGGGDRYGGGGGDRYGGGSSSGGYGGDRGGSSASGGDRGGYDRYGSSSSGGDRGGDRYGPSSSSYRSDDRSGGGGRERHEREESRRSGY